MRHKSPGPECLCLRSSKPFNRKPSSPKPLNLTPQAPTLLWPQTFSNKYSRHCRLGKPLRNVVAFKVRSSTAALEYSSEIGGSYVGSNTLQNKKLGLMPVDLLTTQAALGAFKGLSVVSLAAIKGLKKLQATARGLGLRN